MQRIIYLNGTEKQVKKFIKEKLDDLDYSISGATYNITIDLDDQDN
jgi:hypothetical protein